MAVSEDYDGPTFEYEGERFPFDPARLLGSQVKLMQSRTGYTYQQYVEGVAKADAEAFGFYLWMTLQNAGHAVPKYSEFDYDYFALISSLDGVEEDDGEDPTPPPNRAARRSKKTSGGGGRSSRSTAASTPTGS
jgi:hypothetical protein